MGLVHNVAMHRTYVSLVKECFFVQLPDDVSLRLCAPCLNRMQKVHNAFHNRGKKPFKLTTDRQHQVTPNVHIS